MARAVGAADDGPVYYAASDNAGDGDLRQNAYLANRAGCDWQYLHWNSSADLATEFTG